MNVRCFVPFVFALVASPAFGQAAPTCTLSANPATVAGSGQVVLTWSTTNCAAATGSGAWSGVKDCAGGTQTVTVDSTRTFTLTVKSATGKASIKWTKPTQNTDGTPTTITGYRLFQTNPDESQSTIVFSSPDTLAYAPNLAPGRYEYQIRAVRTDGVESGLSNEVYYQVVAQTASCLVTVTVTSRPRAPTLFIG